MSKKTIEPTDAMVEAVELARTHLVLDVLGILRVALNHPDAVDLLAAEWKVNAEAAAERAERAEDKLADSVHVDEAARRVEAAREQGWDEAAGWVWQRETWTNDELRAANPYRPAPTLPTTDGAVIIPADGREYVEAVADGHTYYAREAMLINGLWRAVWRTPHGFQVCYSVLSWKITPGTWKVDDQ